MMSSPEGFYEDRLKGKSAEEIMNREYLECAKQALEEAGETHHSSTAF